MAADPAQQRRRPTAAETLAALGATDPSAPAFKGTAAAAAAAAGTTAATALTAAQAAAAAASIVRSVLAFGERRATSDYLWVVAALRQRYPEKPESEVEALARKELAFGREFARKQRDRLERDLPAALRLDDPAARAARVQAILDREKRYIGQRREAMAERAIAAAELDSVRASSAEGAFWLLSPFARQHTPLCIALGNKFWPWAALDAVPTPPIHAGCRCSLLTKGEAVERGFMHPDQVPDPADALARAQHYVSTIEEALDAGLSVDDLREAALEEMLRLAELDALYERHLLAEAGDYYGASPWQRFSTGFREGGQFKGRRAGVRSAGRKLEKFLGHLDLRTPAQSRRDGLHEPMTLNGQAVNVPEHRAFDRTIGGTRFTSPPGSTNVYSGGRLIPPGHELRSGGGKQSPFIPPDSVLPADFKPGDHFRDLSGRMYRVDESRPGRGGRTKLRLFDVKLDRTIGQVSYKAEHQGFVRAANPQQLAAEGHAERVRHELALPAASSIAAALGRPGSHQPIPNGTDGATADSALRTLGFREAATARQLGSTRSTYVHPSTGARLDVSFRDDNGRTHSAEWRPRGAERQPAGSLEGKPKSWADFAGYLAAFVEHQGARHGVETHLRSIVHDSSTDEQGRQNTPDHAGMHQWNGDVVLGADVRPAVEAAIRAREAGRALTEAESRDLWTAYRVAHHETLHAVNPVDQAHYEVPHQAAMEEWLAEEASAAAAGEALRAHGFKEAADWAAAHPLDARVQGSYLRIRASADRLLDEAKVAPEDRARLVQELKLAADPSERESILAGLARQGDPGLAPEEALGRVRRAFAAPERLPEGWTPPGGLPGDTPAPQPGGRPEEGTRVLVARRVRDAGGFATRPEEAEVLRSTPGAGGRWIATVRYARDGKVSAATDREVLRQDAGQPSLPAQLHLGDRRTIRDELGFETHVQRTHELAAGDPVAWDGRSDGGVSEGRVVRVHRGGRDWLVEAEAGPRSMAPGGRVMLTPGRTGGAIGAPGELEPPPAPEEEGARQLLARQLGRLRPTDAQARQAAADLGIAAAKASPGEGRDFADLLARALVERNRSRPPLPGYDEGFQEGVDRAVAIARSGGDFNGVADAFREYRAANLPRDAELGDHPHQEGVVTGMIWAACEGRDAAQLHALDQIAPAVGRSSPGFGTPPGWDVPLTTAQLLSLVKGDRAVSQEEWRAGLEGGLAGMLRAGARIDQQDMARLRAAGYDKGGKASPGFEAADPKIVEKAAALQPGETARVKGFELRRKQNTPGWRVTSPSGRTTRDSGTAEEAAQHLAEMAATMPQLRRDKSRESTSPGGAREFYEVVAPDGTVLGDAQLKLNPVASGGTKYATGYAKVWYVHAPGQKSQSRGSKKDVQHWAEELLPKPAAGKASPGFGTDRVEAAELLPGDRYWEPPNWLRPDGHEAVVKSVQPYLGTELEAPGGGPGPRERHLRVEFEDGGVLHVGADELVDVVKPGGMASPGFAGPAQRGKPSPGFFGKKDDLPHGGGKPSWQAKVYGGQKRIDTEPPLDALRSNNGDIVRDPEGETWKVRLTGTTEEPTITLTRRAAAPPGKHVPADPQRLRVGDHVFDKSGYRWRVHETPSGDAKTFAVESKKGRKRLKPDQLAKSWTFSAAGEESLTQVHPEDAFPEGWKFVSSSYGARSAGPASTGKGSYKPKPPPAPPKQDDGGQLTRVEHASGGADFYSDQAGNRWLVQRWGGDADKAAGDLLANSVYRELGVDVPAAQQVTFGGKPAYAAPEQQLPQGWRHLWPPHGVAGTPGAEVDPRIAAVADATVDKGTDAQKEAYSAFDGTVGAEPLASYLRGRGVQRVEIGGLATDYCVRDTALAARRAGFEVTVLRPAVAGIDAQPGDVARSMKAMEDAGVKFEDSPQPGKDAALIAVDVQRDFLPGGALGVPEGDKVVGPLARAAGGGKYATVVASRDWHPADHQSFASQRHSDLGFAADALVGNWNAADRSKLGGAIFQRPSGGSKDFGPVPVEMWTLDSPKGPLLGTGPTPERKAEMARELAARLTPERIDQLVDAAPFKTDGKREAAREALKARLDWMRRLGSGEESLPEPLRGGEAKAELADAQRGFDVRPEEHAALEGFEADPQKVNAALHMSLRFDGSPGDAARLASLEGPAPEAADAVPPFPGDVAVGEASGPTPEEALAEWEKTHGKSQPQFSAGVIVKEPDGRVWMMKPRGGFGGYGMILPKGRVDEGESPQEAALRELYEETGLTAKVTGLVGDYVGDVTITRYFTAERTGGLPHPGEESELVVLGNQLEGGLKARDIGAMRDAGAGGAPPEAAQQIEGLDSLTADAPKLGEDVEAWARLPGELPPDVAGKTLENRGYLGASFDRPAQGKGTLVRLLAPEGARAFSPSASGVPGPDLLFGRGARIRILYFVVEEGKRVAVGVLMP